MLAAADNEGQPDVSLMVEIAEREGVSDRFDSILLNLAKVTESRSAG